MNGQEIEDSCTVQREEQTPYLHFKPDDLRITTVV